MDIRTREAVRYLGYGRHAIDERTLQLVEDEGLFSGSRIWSDTRDRCGCAYETIQSDGYGEGSCSAGVCSCDAGGIL